MPRGLGISGRAPQGGTKSLTTLPPVRAAASLLVGGIGIMHIMEVSGRVMCRADVRLILGLALLATAATPVQGQPILSLAEALEAARRNAPELAQAKTAFEAAEARADIARAPLRPQVTGTLGYERGTYNSAFANPNAAGSTAVTGGTALGSRSRTSLDTRNAFSATLSASQLLWDFGQTRDTWRSARASARAELAEARVTWLELEYQVRAAFFRAAAAKALVQVAQDALDNQLRHFAQIEGFVEVGTRPAIDLAQSRTEVANARLALVRAQNDYALGKSQLERAMGHDPGEYEVSSDLPAPEPDEAARLEVLLAIAERTRPEFAALQHRVRAQELMVSAAEAAHGPSLAVSGSLTENGTALDALAFNAGAGLSLTWPIFQGGAVEARVRETRAQLEGLRLERELLLRDARLELEQALLSLRAAQAAVEIAQEVVVNARDLLQLAEGRYSAGVGNVIELGDAQLELSNAQAQQVVASYELAQARMQLRRGLGR